MLPVHSEGRKHDSELKLSVHLKGQANTFNQDEHMGWGGVGGAGDELGKQLQNQTHFCK